MSAPVYIGDEASAAGYRLAGARTVVPARGGARAAFDLACAEAPMVLVSASAAREIDERALSAATVRRAPLVLVVPDLLEGVPVPDIAARLRAQLGLE
jgi:vacuolar-type H+-ATPase subunit F/Vma7